MLSPFTCSPFDAYPKDVVEAVTTTCLCGREKKLKNMSMVWSHKKNDDKHTFYAFCKLECYIAHVTGGSA